MIDAEIFIAPTQFAVDAAAQGRQVVVNNTENTVDVLVARADRSMRLHGKLTQFLKRFDVRDAELGMTFRSDQSVPQVLQHGMTASQWSTFLQERFTGKKWDSRRYTGKATEWVVVAVFSLGPSTAERIKRIRKTGCIALET